MPSVKASILPTRKALPANSKSKRGGNNGSNEEETQDPASLVKSRKFGIKLQTKKTPPAAGEFEDASAYWKAAQESLRQEGDDDNSIYSEKKKDGKALSREERRNRRAEQRKVTKKASIEALRAQYQEDRNNLQSPDFSVDGSTASASDIVARNALGGRAKNVNSARSFRPRRRRRKNSPMEASVTLFSPSEVSDVSTTAPTNTLTPTSLRMAHSFPLSSNKSKSDTSRRKSETPLSELKGRVLLQGMHSALRRDAVQPRSIDKEENENKLDERDIITSIKNNDVIHEEEAEMDDHDLFPLDMEGGQDSFMANDDYEIDKDHDDNLMLKGLRSRDRSSLGHAAGLLPSHIEDKQVDKDQESNSERDSKEAIGENVNSKAKSREVGFEVEDDVRADADDEVEGEGYELPSDQESPPLQQEQEISRSVTFSKKSPIQEDDELYSGEEDTVTGDGPDANLEDEEDSGTGQNRVQETDLNGSNIENFDVSTAVTPDERLAKKRSRKRVTYARDAFGYPAGNRDYKTIPVEDFVDSDDSESGHRPRRSKRVRVAPLEFWKNEKYVYEPHNEKGRFGKILGDMPVVSGICKALPTPYKKRKLNQGGNQGQGGKTRKGSKAKRMDSSNEQLEPFNATKLLKVSDYNKYDIYISFATRTNTYCPQKYKFSSDNYANTWHEPTQQVELQSKLNKLMFLTFKI